MPDHYGLAASVHDVKRELLAARESGTAEFRSIVNKLFQHPYARALADREGVYGEREQPALGVRGLELVVEDPLDFAGRRPEARRGLPVEHWLDCVVAQPLDGDFYDAACVASARRQACQDGVGKRANAGRRATRGDALGLEALTSLPDRCRDLVECRGQSPSHRLYRRPAGDRANSAAPGQQGSPGPGGAAKSRTTGSTHQLISLNHGKPASGRASPRRGPKPLVP